MNTAALPQPLSTCPSQGVLEQGQDAAASAGTQAEGAVASAETAVADGTRALPGLGEDGAADPYAQDPEDKKMFGTCKTPGNCVIC